jgi:hypothetical protein
MRDRPNRSGGWNKPVCKANDHGRNQQPEPQRVQGEEGQGVALPYALPK